MDVFSQMGRWLVLVGISLVLTGGLVWLFGKTGGFKDFPGTVRMEWNGVGCIFPLLASILLSIVLTLVLNGVLRIFRH